MILCNNVSLNGGVGFFSRVDVVENKSESAQISAGLPERGNSPIAN